MEKYWNNKNKIDINKVSSYLQTFAVAACGLRGSFSASPETDLEENTLEYQITMTNKIPEFYLLDCAATAPSMGASGS